MIRNLAFGILLLFISCQNPANITEAPVKDVTKPVELKNFTYEDVAKYAMSVIMGHPPKIMNVEKQDDLYIVSYIRKSDGQKFTYKLRFNSNTVVWANIDGRWRDSPYDEKLEFEEQGNALLIHTAYSDGSKETTTFNHSM